MYVCACVCARVRVCVCACVCACLSVCQVNVMLENAEFFGFVLFGEGGSASGWRCC